MDSQEESSQRAAGQQAGEPPARAPVVSAAAGLTLLVGIGLWWLPVESALAHFVSDDYFYYLVFAGNLIEHGHPSFDRLHPTNGFHPLFMAVCVAIRSVVDDDGTLIRAGLSALLLAHAAGACATLGFVRTRLGLAPSVAGLVLFFSPLSLSIVLSGHETALYTSATLLAFLALNRVLEVPSRGGAAILGIAVGAAALARLDGLLLLPVVALALIAASGRERHFAGTADTAVRLAITIGIAVALVTPFLLWGKSATDSLLPISRDAMQFSKFGEDRLGSLLAGDFATPWKRLEPVINTSRWAAAWGGKWELGWPSPANAIYVLCVVVAGGVGAWRARVTIPAARWVVLFLALHTAYYLAFANLNPRYLFVQLLLLPIGAVYAVQQQLRAPSPGASPSSNGRSRAFGWAAAAMVCLSLGSATRDAWSRGMSLYNPWHTLHGALYTSIPEFVEQTVPSGELFGAFNAGILGFRSGRQVVNLDGVMNNRAARAMREQRLREYLAEEEIHYVGDWRREQVDVFLRNGGWQDWERHARLVGVLDAAASLPNNNGRFVIYQLRSERGPRID